MSKPLLGLVLGAALGLLDGLSAFFSPEAAPMMVEIVVGSTLKGLVTGVLAGLFARRMRSMPLGIAFALVVGLILSYLAALTPDPQGKHHFLEIMLPGGLLAAIVGFATQRYGRGGGATAEKARLALVLFVLTGSASAAVKPQSESPWAPIRFLVGDWEGESEGQPGRGSVKRTYRFVLGDRFLHEQNVSTYPPQPKNEKGEVHEHRSYFSHDRARHTLVLRQFHQEGFVNQYVMTAGSPAGTVVFDTESLENVPSGWKARETYQLVSPDEFVETFELAQEGGAYELYSKARFKRAQGSVALPKGLEPLRFLLGDWQASGGGKPDEASGGFTFAASLQDRVILRTNYAVYPAVAEKPASRHDDLMVLYAAEAGEIHADYYDNEGHVIRYSGRASTGELVLTSDASSSGPRFRLSYKLGPDGALDGRFEVAPPGKPESFGPYLAWSARRRGASQ